MKGERKKERDRKRGGRDGQKIWDGYGKGKKKGRGEEGEKGGLIGGGKQKKKGGGERGKEQGKEGKNE